MVDLEQFLDQLALIPTKAFKFLTLSLTWNAYTPPILWAKIITFFAFNLFIILAIALASSVIEYDFID